MSDLKPIKVWGKNGPTPPKVAFVLEELGLPYEIVNLPITESKRPDYVAINPNGRIPAIYDPNFDLTLWESGAIVEYLVEKYDKDHKISFAPGSKEAYQAKQYLFFQASGQGPYYGQAVWFKRYHSENLPSAIDRYIKETNRVTGVVEKILADTKVEAGSDGPWLVGGRFSYADLAWLMWQHALAKVHTKEEYNEEDYPHVKAWLDKMRARPAIKKVLDSLN